VNKIYAVLKIKGKNGPSTSSKAIRKTMIASSETQSRQGFPGLADFLKKKIDAPPLPQRLDWDASDKFNGSQN